MVCESVNVVKQCQLLYLAQITVPDILTLLGFSLTLSLSRSLLLMLFDGLLDCVQVRLMVLDSLRVSDCGSWFFMLLDGAWKKP